MQGQSIEPPVARAPVAKRLTVLLLCNDSRGHANTVLDHIAAFTRYSRHRVRTFNPLWLNDCKLLSLDEFDALVIHYSIYVPWDSHLSPKLKEKIRAYQGLKIQFIQDEYRRVDEVTAMMRDLGVQVVFTLLSKEDASKVYSPERLPGVELVPCLAGYVPENLQRLALPPVERRPIDIGYRGRTLPFWLGRLAQEKVWIGQGILAAADRYGWACDIGWAEGDRLYGRKWSAFLSSCKATLGTESGASITDFDGSIEQLTRDYLGSHSGAGFDEVFEAVLRPYEGNLRITAISPRVFEAVALKTALILFPGDYSRVVQPGVHYIPLAKDFSNLDDVAARLRDLVGLRAMTETVYRDVVASGRYSYRAFITEFDAVVDRHGQACRSGRFYGLRFAHVERSLRFGAERTARVGTICVRRAIALVKTCAALGVLLRLEGGGTVLARYLTRTSGVPGNTLGTLCKDVFRLTLAELGRRAALRGTRPFAVAVQPRPREGRLVFVSLPVHEGGGQGGPGRTIAGETRAPDEASTWRALAGVIREGRLESIVWDHSAIGGKFRYPWLVSVELSTDFGESDAHRFHALEELASWDPEMAVRLLWSVLRLDRVDGGRPAMHAPSRQHGPGDAPGH